LLYFLVAERKIPMKTSVDRKFLAPDIDLTVLRKDRLFLLNTARLERRNVHGSGPTMPTKATIRDVFVGQGAFIC
jgi:hypothetical protein